MEFRRGLQERQRVGGRVRTALELQEDNQRERLWRSWRRYAAEKEREWPNERRGGGVKQQLRMNKIYIYTHTWHIWLSWGLWVLALPFCVWISRKLFVPITDIEYTLFASFFFFFNKVFSKFMLFVCQLVSATMSIFIFIFWVIKYILPLYFLKLQKYPLHFHFSSHFLYIVDGIVSDIYTV